MGKSDIEWTEHSWNPVTGCTKISAGCKNCYAARMAKRLQAMGQANYINGFDVACHEHMLSVPMDRNKPTKYFVNSMSDIFHEDVPDLFIMKVLSVIEHCKQHKFIMLTKRLERARQIFSDIEDGMAGYIVAGLESEDPTGRDFMWDNFPIPNLMLVASVEDQPSANERLPELLRTQVALRGVSYEPALGPVDFNAIKYITGENSLVSGLEYKINAFKQRSQIDVVIMGGESGPGARPMHPDWARSTRDQCRASGVSFFFKQWGEWMFAGSRGEFCFNPGASIRELITMDRVGKKAAGYLLDGIEHREWPND